jgi:PhoPQ-activated pathogenicity-related protein
MNSSYCLADPKPCYSNLSEVMNCFVNYQDNAYKYQIIEQKNENNLIVKTYILDSQKWPIGFHSDIPTTTWQHKLKIYIPTNVSHHKAMIYVGGGYNTNNKEEKIFSDSKEILDFSNIAIENKAVVAIIEDVPNQYLLINSTLKKEDQILAYSYKKVMENPMENAYLAGHLPMVKSIVKAMDATQEILQSEHNIEIKDFMMVGASKRGWAAWLAALEDNRVSSLAPIVIDILNVQKNIYHICKSYIKGCPPALRDYKNEDVLQHMNSNNFTELMKIEDPFNYLSLKDYNKQASIPKYIINAAGDDFYAPDSSKFYFKDLPGENHIRYLPKAMHYFAGNPISDHLNNLKSINEALDNYFYFQIHNVTLPEVNWQRSQGKIIIDSSIKPTKIKLWHATNDKERDFRFLNSYTKFHTTIKFILTYVDKYFSISLCDNCYYESDIPNNCTEGESCHIEAKLPFSNKGWQASFVELYYNIEDRDFIVTTEIGITPDTYPITVE